MRRLSFSTLAEALPSTIFHTRLSILLSLSLHCRAWSRRRSRRMLYRRRLFLFGMLFLLCLFLHVGRVEYGSRMLPYSIIPKLKEAYYSSLTHSTFASSISLSSKTNQPSNSLPSKRRGSHSLSSFHIMS